MIVMCSCGRAKVYEATRWHVPGEGWAMAVDKDPSQPNAISHGLCPECAEKANREVDELAAEAEKESR